MVVVEMLESELQELGCAAVEVLRTAGPALRRELVHAMVRTGTDPKPRRFEVASMSSATSWGKVTNRHPP